MHHKENRVQFRTQTLSSYNPQRGGTFRAWSFRAWSFGALSFREWSFGAWSRNLTGPFYCTNTDVVTKILLVDERFTSNTVCGVIVHSQLLQTDSNNSMTRPICHCYCVVQPLWQWYKTDKAEKMISKRIINSSTISPGWVIVDSRQSTDFCFSGEWTRTKHPSQRVSRRDTVCQIEAKIYIISFAF